LAPVVGALERLRWPRARTIGRPAATLIVVLAIGGLIGLAVALGIPVLVRQLVEFAGRLPGQIDTLVEQMRARAAASAWGPGLLPSLDALRGNARTLVPQAGTLLVRGLGGLFSRFEEIVAVAVLPVLTFYLLA